jgi:type IV fimbrial biogenesis protein FimT
MLGAMTKPRRPFFRRGLTLVELLIVVAVLAILGTLVGPSIRDLVLMQRLRSINSQLVTDLQFARSEAVSRGVLARVGFDLDAADQTCYVIYTRPTGNLRCDCTRGPGNACAGVADAFELRTVQVLRDTGVAFANPTRSAWVAFDPATGGLMTNPSDRSPAALDSFGLETRIDDSRRLRTSINRTGRPSVCAPAGAEQRTQVTACPP